MASDNVFGSDELTPELLRSATFAEQDGRIDADEVRTYLDRVASSLEVLASQDAPSALRAEFSRNAEIAQQVLDAGQNAAEQLRRQAAEDARRMLDEARDATLHLRSSVETEISQSRVQVDSMRGQFIQDLRDLYDRIGASLYRFERAADEASHEPIVEPAREGSSSVEAAAHTEYEPAADPAPAPMFEDAAPELPPTHPGLAAEHDEDSEQGELKPPAWQQLPPQAWDSQPAGHVPPPEPAADPFAIVEDEPLAPGEPLVDLRELGDATAPGDESPESAASVESPEGVGDDLGGSWLAAEVPEAPADAAPLPGDAGASWLDPGAVTDHSDPGLAHDEALANALIGAEPVTEASPPSAVPPPARGAGAAGASADAVAVRQVILDSLAAGQSRESVEAYLRDHMGLLEPGALVDAALASGSTTPEA